MLYGKNRNVSMIVVIHGHRLTVENRRREFPLPDCVKSRLPEQWRALYNACVANTPVGLDGHVDRYDTLDAG